MADFPTRIGYRWQDDNTGTPYSLTFDNLPSAISFIVSQRNNLMSADEILESLFDVDTGKSLSDPSVPASVDDVASVAATQGTTLPEAPTADPETDETAPDPQSTDTTATANTVGTSIETSQTSTPVSSGLADTTGPELAPSAETITPTGSNVPDAPFVSSSGEAPSVPSSVDDTATDTATPGTIQDSPSSDDTSATEPGEFDGESDDFDAEPGDRNADDEPETAETAPSIGTPTTDTDGVTGTATA